MILFALALVPCSLVVVLVSYGVGFRAGSKAGFFRGRDAGLLARDRTWLEAVTSYRWPVMVGTHDLPLRPVDRSAVYEAIVARFAEAKPWDEATAVPRNDKRLP